MKKFLSIIVFLLFLLAGTTGVKAQPVANCKPITAYLDANGIVTVHASDIDAGSTASAGIASLMMNFDNAFVCGQATESQNLTMHTVGGALFDVVQFASYGTPTGTCGDYHISGCHVGSSQGIAESYALGHTSFTIQASNILFGGDPCRGIVKRLYIQAKFEFPQPVSSITFTCVDKGSYPVKLFVTDLSGNVSTCSTTITIIDNTNPVIQCPDDVTINANPGLCSGTTALIPPTVTDNCAVTGITITNNAPATFPVGTTPVSWTATDASGNSASCIQMVTVVDNQFPALAYGALGMTADPDFNPAGAGAAGTVFAIAKQGDGKILIGGSFQSYNGNFANRITRLNADGTTDNSFNTAGAGATGTVFAIAIQGDGKILIGGSFQSYNGISANRITRLNADGTTDYSFNPSASGANGTVNAIAIQSDGKILIGGTFTSFNGVPANYFTRLNTNGTKDVTFNSNGGGGQNITTTSLGSVSSIAVKSDGKILIGGKFNFWDDEGFGYKLTHLALLQPDGSPEDDFLYYFHPYYNGANNTVNSIALQNDGKILIGGAFTNYNGAAANRIIRLNSNFTRDGTFTGAGANSNVNAIALQRDGKILIGGAFTNYNGSPCPKIIRLNSNGLLDPDFGTFGSGASINVTSVNAIYIPGDYEILVGGLMQTYDGLSTTSISITRLIPALFLNAATGACTAPVNYTPVFATDNCGIASISYDPPSGSPLPLGISTVTATITDIHDNVSTQNFKVSVTGNNANCNGTAPVITCPDDIHVNNANGQCGAVVSFTNAYAATATGSPEPTITYSPASGFLFPVGSTPVTATASNSNGTATCTFNVVVTDNEPPVLKDNSLDCSSLSQENVNECYSDALNFNPSALIPAVANLYKDNCGTVAASLLNVIYGAGNSNCKWQLTYVYLIADGNGNSVTCNVTRGGNDQTAPVLKTGSVIPSGGTLINACVAPAGPSEADIAALYEDACGGAITVVKTVGAETVGVCGWSVTYHYTIKDQCGNYATPEDVTYSGSDQTAPVLKTGSVIPSGGMLINACVAPAGPSEADIAALYEDACGGAITVVKTVGAETVGVCGWSVTYHYTIKDQCGNYATPVDVTYSGSDQTPPTFTAPADVTIPFTSACGYDASPGNTGDVTDEHDNCASVLAATYTDVVSQCGNNIIITRTWSLEDDCENAAASQVQKITVTDNNTDYIVYASKEAKFGEDNVINGDVGVTDANGKAEFKKGTVLDPNHVYAQHINVHMPATVNNKHFMPATGGPTPPFYNYAGGGLSGHYTQSSNGVVPAGNFKNLTIKKNVTATVNGSNYGKITIEENARVTFTSGSIDVEEISVKKGKNPNTTNIMFSNCTAVRVKDKVDIEDNCRVNVDGPKVTFHLGDNKKDDEKFSVKGDNTEVTANVIMPNGKMKVEGGHGSCIMTGWYIIEKLDANGKNVTWNKYDCMMAKGRITTSAESRKTPVEEITKAFNVSVYPNPSAAEFRILVNSSINEPVHIRLFDISGRTMKQISRAAGNTFIIDANDLLPGTYFAEVRQGINKTTLKLVKL